MCAYISLYLSCGITLDVSFSLQKLQEIADQVLINNGVARDDQIFQSCSTRLFKVTKLFVMVRSFVSKIVSNVLFLAHLSQRLIGELIGYSWSSVRPYIVHPSLTISNIFFSKTACPIKAKFYVEPPWVGGTKVCSRHLGHMTKMATTPIYGKNPSKIFFSRTGGPIFKKLGM